MSNTFNNLGKLITDTLVINTLGTGTSINNIGIDASGNVVTGTTGSVSDIYVTGGTYSTGTATFTNSTGGTFDVTGFTEGSGTLNYVTKWTPDGNTLGDSIIRDDGTNVGVSVSPFANVKLYVNGSGTQVGLWSRTSGNPTTLTYGSISENLNTSGTAYGIEGRAIQSGTGTRYGGYFRATSGTSNYSLLLQDGTEGVGKFLQCVTPDGSANWVTLPEFTGNTSGDCITDLYVTNLYGCSPLHIDPSGLNNVYIVENGGNVGIGTTATTVTLDVAGETRLSGSGQNVLTVIGSGDTQPLFKVEGSSGELFSITDSLVGSLFSVNDISGLPILEVFDDDTVHMGNYQAPSLNTTVLLNPSTGLSTVYSIPMSAYTGAWFEYTVSNTGGARAGQIMSIFSGNTVNFTETTTTDIGSTSDVTFSMSADSTNTLLQVSATTSGWEVKTIVRSI